MVIATNRDDATALVALTARELAPKAHIVAAVRERETYTCCDSPAPTPLWRPPRPRGACSAWPLERLRWSS